MDLITHLLPDTPGLRFESLTVDEPEHRLTLVLTSVQPRACCPQCHTPCHRVHSRYTRCLADLPWADWSIRLPVQVRKFRCLTRQCTQIIFAERLPTFAAPWGRRTLRLMEAIHAVGLALGGMVGQRLARRLALPTSRDTLLTLVRETSLPASPAPRVIGIDDWAWRKGQTYASIVVNLLTHRPLALLPDREATTVAAWLRAPDGAYGEPRPLEWLCGGHQGRCTNGHPSCRPLPPA